MPIFVHYRNYEKKTMPPISKNEMRSRALKFSQEWKNETRERAEKDTFWNEFLAIFGIDRKRVATFEESVKRLGGKQGYIDLFWKGHILAEHKSRGEDLNKAYEQAVSYFDGIKERDLPKYVIISDFYNFHIHSLEERRKYEFTIEELVDNLHILEYLAGYKKRSYQDEDPVNIKAAERMGKLHDRLEAVGYKGHALEVYLVRLLFCLFAEDTNIFDKGMFSEYIDLHTKEDGSDLAMHLAHLFETLNRAAEQRLSTLDDSLSQFPYVNGKLFSEPLPFAAFDSNMREMLLDACALDWSGISPAIFGSMFQAVMNPQKRRNLGAHYTSERNIMKLIRPLFLDELYLEFEKAKDSLPKLQAFQEKLSKLTFLDPACGSGNFLIITYRELRELEIKVLEEIFFVKRKYRPEVLADANIKIDHFIKVNVDQFYGIEYDEFASEIARLGMWLIDHQMNMKVSQTFGQYYVRLPLQRAANILHANSLRTNWEDFVPKDKLKYIIGNPPFYGSKLQSEQQRNDLEYVFGKDVKDAKIMDYVSAWYIKAAQYIQNTAIQVAFVSTNSIVQGEQVSVLWGQMLNKYKIKINFAHRTFKWENDAKGNAAVYCVIVGFACFDNKEKVLFDYTDDITGEPEIIKAKNINPYLVDALDALITKRTTPIANVPEMSFGNMPLDGGHLLLSDDEKIDFLKKEPKAEKFIKPLISAYEFLNGVKRWCLWLVDASPNELREMPEVLKRIEAVKKFRLDSIAPSTQKFAATASLFRDRNNPESYILIPSTTSENRKYIPMGFFGKEHIASNSCHIIPKADLFLFGILMSEMHMAWVRYICGRLKSDFRYSKNIVYNNYPFPKSYSPKQKEKVEKAAQAVLEIRALYPESSLADLYNPLTMPANLVKAHQTLDKAVDLCYRPQLFSNERVRIEFLFQLYEEYTIPLLK